MKMTNYRLQTEIENINIDKTEWFKNYVRQVLESNKPYHAKADYIGLSIKELQTLKKNLTLAKTTALEAIAEVLVEYGIDKLDGTVISSITITPKKSKTKDTLNIINADALIKLGYFSVIVDKSAVEEAMGNLESMDEIDKFVEISSIDEITPARIKVNSRRSSVNNQATELLSLVENEAA